MRNIIKRMFEACLLSNHKAAIWTLPVLATVFAFTALWGAGAFGAPDLAVNSLKKSHEEATPLALRAADGAVYEDWDGPTPEMSSFIRSQINANLREARETPDFYGSSFASAPALQPVPQLSDEAGPLSNTEKPAAGPASPTEPIERDSVSTEGDELSASRQTIEAWSAAYWCARSSWDEPWLGEIVRPLVVRGVGNCSFWQRFSARSPLISSTSAGWGVALFVLLSVLAFLFVLLFTGQILLREAYRMQYRSEVFP